MVAPAECFGDAPGEQLKLLEGASKNLARMVKEGINVVVTHGNGPQVGIIDEAFEVASKDKDAQVPPMPLSDCNAMSQGYIGAQLSCALRNEFHRQDIMREGPTCRPMWWSTPMTPPSRDYEKPIGASGDDRIRGPRLREGHGIPGARDPARGWRRVVPRPVPQDIVELETVRDLTEDGCVVIGRLGAAASPLRCAMECIPLWTPLWTKISRARSSPGACGPIPRHPDGGEGLLDFGKPTQKALDAMTVSEARAYMEQGTVRARLHAAAGRPA